MNSVFTHECFGTYKDMEYFGTNKFGVMIREESIAITNALKRLQEAKPVHWEAIHQMSKEELKEYVEDEEHYMHIFT